MSEAPRFGSYEVVSELGSGTLATVYKALQQPLGRKVAIKALKSTISPASSFASSLEREARILAELLHPNIAALLDFVKTSDQMYLVLEYISGFSLADVLAKKHKLRPEVVAALGAQVARALAHVHERGVVHRDIKPANLIIDRRGDVKLVDFGIAQRERDSATSEALTLSREPLFGTPAYMAPEQLLGDVALPASDLFSLGVVLYQCLAAAKPFDREADRQGDAGRATGLRTRRDPPVPLRARVADVPRVIERLIMSCLEKNPDDRPASAREVATELESFVRGRTEASFAELAGSALVAARLRPAEVSKSRTRLTSRAAVPPAWSSPWTLLGATAALGVGLAAVRLAARAEPEEPSGAPPVVAMAAASLGQVRVLATPWAEVSVDGQPADVTPISRPIQLSPGAHYFAFAHPAATTELRRVVVTAGESITLDVTMAIAGLTAADAAVDGGGR
jgi:serine/threonine-protein kinase